MSSVLYAIDTCSIVGAHKWYPKGAFGGVWSLLDELIDEGRLWVPAEVLVELEKHDGDPSHAWVKSNKDRCVAEPDDDVQASLMSQVLPLYPPQAQAKFAKERAKGRADPWLVATASAYEMTVITEEERNTGTGTAKIKVPNVCDGLKIECITLSAMLEREGGNW